MTTRRHFLAGAGAAAAFVVTGFPAIASTRTLRIGYLRGLSSDAHLWTADHLGSFAAEGLAIETVQFVSGLEAYQALVGGGVDLVTTGAVISNFPARGQGRAFLINVVEHNTAQLWGHPNQGVESLADIAGKRVGTTRGTTAHFFLHKLLQANGLDSEADIEIIHQPMGNAVTSFISGATPAVATWVPFDTSISQSAPGARLLATSGDYPEASILNGWSARNNIHADDRDVLRRFVNAWLPANDRLVNDTAAALDYLHEAHYSDFSRADIQHQYDVARWHSADDWAELYRNGYVTETLDAVTAFNVEVGAFENPLPASEYFDPSLLLETVPA